MVLLEKANGSYWYFNGNHWNFCDGFYWASIVIGIADPQNFWNRIGSEKLYRCIPILYTVITIMIYNLHKLYDQTHHRVEHCIVNDCEMEISGLRADIWNHTISSLFNKNLYNL